MDKLTAQTQTLAIAIKTHINFGAKVEILNYRCDYVGVQFSNANGYYMINGSIHMTYDGGSTGKCISEFRFLLHPLSSFTDINSKAMNDLNLDLEDQIDLCQLANGNISVNALLHGIAVECFRNHIDIYGLIDFKSLAVDINTLGKEDQNV